VEGRPRRSIKPRTGSSTERAENQEALETGAVVGKTVDLVHEGIDHELLADSVVAAGKVREYLLCQKRVDQQLLAPSSLPVIKVSGWNSDW
jgi:hypothetical protein